MLKLIANDNFIIINKEIANIIGLDEAIILGELASEYNYWERNGKLDNDYFFSTIENIEKSTTLKEKRQRSAFNKLKELGIIDIKIKGMPAKRYIKINEEVLYKTIYGETSYAKMAELDTPKWRSNNNNKIITNKYINKSSSKNRKETPIWYDDYLKSANKKIEENEKNNDEIDLEDFFIKEK